MSEIESPFQFLSTSKVAVIERILRIFEKNKDESGSIRRWDVLPLVQSFYHPLLREIGRKYMSLLLSVKKEGRKDLLQLALELAKEWGEKE